MRTAFYKCFINLIVIFSLLLALCVVCDYAANVTMNTTADDVALNDSSKVIGVSEEDSNLVVRSSDKVHTVPRQVAEKRSVPTISMWAKPSVRSGYSYKWYRFEWIDYCPNCHHYNCLLKNPKGVPEGEFTCGVCDSDYCAVTGKEKYDWSSVYLRRM